MPKFKDGKSTNYYDMQGVDLRIGDIITAQAGMHQGRSYRVVSPESAKETGFGFMLDLGAAKTARDFLVTRRWNENDPGEPEPEEQEDVVDINLDDIPEAPELKDREQPETLAAENEMLMNENEKLKELVRKVQEVADGCAKANTGLQKDLNEAREARKASEDARLKALEELAASELAAEGLKAELKKAEDIITARDEEIRNLVKVREGLRADLKRCAGDVFHLESEVNRLKGENQCLQDIVKAQDETIGKVKEGAATCGFEAYDTKALVEELTSRGFTGHVERHEEYSF